MTLLTQLPLSLFGGGEPRLSSPCYNQDNFQRYQLDPCCWVDYAPAMISGADTLFSELETRLPWEQGRRFMYGRWVDEPRLSARLELDHPQLPVLTMALCFRLEQHYGRCFDGIFCNYYRNGSDSIAWHADRIGRTHVDPLVAVLSLGGPREFAMRDQSGHHQSIRWTMHSGDLLVMGGATQHHWQHSVPKTTLAAPRISLTTRAG